MQNLKQIEDLGGMKVIKCPKPMFIRAKTFIKDAKKGDFSSCQFIHSQTSTSLTSNVINNS